MKLVVLICLVVVLMECTSAFLIKELLQAIFRKRDKCIIPARCDVQLLAFERNDHCRLQRQKEIAIARHWYQVTEESSPRGTEFPLTQIPWLNQTLQNTGGFYAMDDFEASYFSTFQTWLTIAKTIESVINTAFKDAPYESTQEFIGLNQAMNKAYSQQNPTIVGNPSMHSDFTDQVTNSQWRTDEAFVQRRLAFECPFTLRKVVKDGDEGIDFDVLAKVMNPEIEDLEFKIDDKKTINFDEAIDQGRLFVQYLEDMNDVPTQSDKTPREGRQMIELTSTISYFILNSNGMFSPVAIQIDNQKDAEVVKPSDGDKWEITKVRADFIHNSWCQSYVHLGEVHFVNTVYCLTFRRHLSEKHPLYDFFKYHCEGTVAHISVSYTALTAPGSSGEQNFALGKEGFIQLSSKAYAERKYGKFSFENMMKNGGLDDERIKYYPFRDDVKVILSEYKRFARALTRQYYGRRYRDYTSKDVELQSWANELSQGVGKMTGFPSSIPNRKTLENFIINFLWINVLHSITNYPLAPDFVPISPPKLYEAAPGTPALTPNQIFMNGDRASSFALGRSRLSNFRVNRIFDYYEKVKDKRFGELVRKSFHRMHGCVQKKLSGRNAERKKNGLLGYQYLEPKWLTNSIHI